MLKLTFFSFSETPVQGKQSNMTNYSNMARKIPAFNTMDLWMIYIFEILVAIVSLSIVISSSLVIHHIAEIQRRRRADIIFIVLSLSDIGVGLFTMPLFGSYWYFASRQLQIPIFVKGGGIFLGDFPYNFSYFLTAIVAVDRLLVITLQLRYENIFTRKRLMGTIAMLFVFTLAYSAVWTYYKLAGNQDTEAFKAVSLGYQVMCSISILIIISSYTYILYFVRRSSNTRLLRRNSHNRTFGKRLTVTILCIFISQCLCTLPYKVFSIMPLTNTAKIRATPWIVLIRNSQCFWNALIMLKNQSKPKLSKETQRKLNELAGTKTTTVFDIERYTHD